MLGHNCREYAFLYKGWMKSLLDSPCWDTLDTWARLGSESGQSSLLDYLLRSELLGRFKSEATQQLLSMLEKFPLLLSHFTKEDPFVGAFRPLGELQMPARRMLQPLDGAVKAFLNSPGWILSQKRLSWTQRNHSKLLQLSRMPSWESQKCQLNITEHFIHKLFLSTRHPVPGGEYVLPPTLFYPSLNKSLHRS